MLHVKNAHFSYGPRTILSDLSLSLNAGEIGTLIGSSGSGKSTLFKLVTGLHAPDLGTVQINGHPSNHSQVSCMMQEDLLLPWRTVVGNITLISEFGKSKPSPDNLIEEVGLTTYRDHFPEQLSGGMRQRVALARALLQNKPLLLLDEPFGALDVILREQMYELLRKIRKKYGTTMLMVTHDFRDATSLSDKIFCLSKGKIVKEWAVTDAERANPNELFHEMREALSR